MTRFSARGLPDVGVQVCAHGVGQQLPRYGPDGPVRPGGRLSYGIRLFGPVLTCSLPILLRGPANTLSVAEYCNPHVDKLASQTQALELTDPAPARKLWAQVDCTVTDQAPWIPLENAAPTVFDSSRVGNYQESAGYGPLPDQTWIP